MSKQEITLLYERSFLKVVSDKQFSHWSYIGCQEYRNVSIIKVDGVALLMTDTPPANFPTLYSPPIMCIARIHLA